MKHYVTEKTTTYKPVVVHEYQKMHEKNAETRKLVWKNEAVQIDIGWKILESSGLLKYARMHIPARWKTFFIGTLPMQMRRRMAPSSLKLCPTELSSSIPVVVVKPLSMVLCASLSIDSLHDEQQSRSPEDFPRLPP